MLVERFGNYLTVFNDGGAERKVELKIDGLDAPIPFTMKSYDLRVFDLNGNSIEY